MTKRLLLTSIISWIFSGTTLAGTYEWTEGFAMGTVEYLVDDNNGNSLVISCPLDDEDRFISAFAHIQDKQYSSSDIDSGGFDVIIDGVHFDNPFHTECSVCGDLFTNSFWPALRKANRLQLSIQGKTINLPVKNLNKVLKPLDHPENPCRSAW